MSAVRVRVRINLTLTPRCTQEPSVVTDRDGREDLLVCTAFVYVEAVHLTVVRCTWSDQVRVL